jgi:hypothetical protein
MIAIRRSNEAMNEMTELTLPECRSADVCKPVGNR